MVIVHCSWRSQICQRIGNISVKDRKRKQPRKTATGSWYHLSRETPCHLILHVSYPKVEWNSGRWARLSRCWKTKPYQKDKSWSRDSVLQMKSCVIACWLTSDRISPILLWAVRLGIARETCWLTPGTMLPRLSWTFSIPKLGLATMSNSLKSSSSDHPFLSGSKASLISHSLWKLSYCLWESGTLDHRYYTGPLLR